MKKGHSIFYYELACNSLIGVLIKVDSQLYGFFQIEMFANFPLHLTQLINLFMSF